jgi:HlyD family secretion protein
MKRIIIGVLIVGLIGAGASAYFVTRADTPPQVSTVAVTRGEIVETVTATGTVAAVTTVQVGSQVSGTVAWLGADFNSVVHKGQVIAKLDPSLLEAQLRQSRANLAKAQADVERARVQLTDANQKYARAAQLAAKQILARSDLDAAKLAVESGEADVHAAQAQLAQAEAALYQNEVNVAHAIITAPIDGIVVGRSVDVGQTVAASLQSPTLFEIAADLTKMQVKASVDESDMGRVRAGESVSFTVDAYPDETFTGTVCQVRLQPTVVQNVTTYISIINVANPDLKLKPGMTASIRILIARRADALRVANAALRFRPTAAMFAALGSQKPGAGKQESGIRSQESGAWSQEPGVRSLEPGARSQEKAVWTYSNGRLTSVPVRLGLSDGITTELLDAPIQAGTLVVTGITLDSSAATSTRKTTTSPLTGGRSMGGLPGGPPPPM